MVKPVCVVQVNGHLDYMKQMDTILVAVGVPTKDRQGASFALPQPVTLTEGTAEPHDRPPRQDPEGGATQNQLEEEKLGSGVEEGKGVTGDGWDIPDISDLLDSLDDSEAASQCASGTSVQQNTADESEAKAALDGAHSEGSEVSEDGDPESRHLSWSWEDTNWNMEQTHNSTKKQQQKHLNL